MNEQEPGTTATQQLDVQPVTEAEASVTELTSVAFATTASEPAAAEAAIAQLAVPEPAVVEPAVVEPALQALTLAEPEQCVQPAPIAQAVVEAPPEVKSSPEVKTQPVAIPVAEQAPLVAATPSVEPQPASEPNQLLGLPLQLVNQLLARLGATPLQSLAELLPALRIISLLVVAGITLKLTGATLGAINEIPLVGRLLELVGLISALNFLARNATKSQKRAELLARIQKLKRDLLG